MRTRPRPPRSSIRSPGAEVGRLLRRSEARWFPRAYRPGRLAVEGPIRRGPYVPAVGATEATVCFESVTAVAGKVACDGRTISDAAGLRHELAIRELKPGTRYSYTIQPG